MTSNILAKPSERGHLAAALTSSIISLQIKSLRAVSTSSSAMQSDRPISRYRLVLFEQWRELERHLTALIEG